MNRPFIPRRLIHTNKECEKGTSKVILQNEIFDLDTPVIILGEAGMGKTTLLDSLSESQSTHFITAAKFRRSFNLDNLERDTLLVIDALDEASQASEGGALDDILRKLSTANHPRFILSCRVADWRGASSVASITEDYGAPPAELHLQAFSRKEAIQFLSHKHNREQAEKVLNHFESLGLDDLTGNPQTLVMIETVMDTEKLPETKAELYAHATHKLAQEHNERKQNSLLAQLDSSRVLQIAGAIFSALLLTGKEAIWKSIESTTPESDISAVKLTGIADATIDEIEAILGSRLFSGTSNSFIPIHRSIAEYLAAKWLGKTLKNDPLKAQRILACFSMNERVPASLRGLHAWLARQPFLTESVMQHDPMGLVEYGDTDNLSIKASQQLLEALLDLDKFNPDFRESWNISFLNCLMRPEFYEQLTQILSSHSVGYSLKSLLLDAMTGTKTANHLQQQLAEIINSADTAYAIQQSAVKALTSSNYGPEKWRNLLDQLIKKDSMRIALDILKATHLKPFCDEQIAQTIWLYCAHNSSVSVDTYDLVEKVPLSRSQSLLDLLEQYARAESSEKTYFINLDSAITDIVFELVARCLSKGSVTGKQLWNWIEPFCNSHGYRKEFRQKIIEKLNADPVLRGNFLHYVFLDYPDENNFNHQKYHLQSIFSDFRINTTDILELLKTFTAENRSKREKVRHWMGIVNLAAHPSTEGNKVRAAARNFAGERKYLHKYLDNLTKPWTPRWKKDEEKVLAKNFTNRIAKFSKLRAKLTSEIAEVRQGNYSAIILQARIFLNPYRDYVHQDMGAINRLRYVFGTQLTLASIQGFEAFLNSEKKPTALQIAEDHANNETWHAEQIIIAGLAFRYINNQNFVDIHTDRLIAGRLALQYSGYLIDTATEGLGQAIDWELKSRCTAYETYWRLLIEPQFRTGRNDIVGLYNLPKDNDWVNFSAKLATEWLTDFPSMSLESERLLLTVLFKAKSNEFIKKSFEKRDKDFWQNKAQFLRWLAAAFYTKPESIKNSHAKIFESHPEIIWNLKELYELNNTHQLSAGILHWLITIFRKQWLYTEYPSGGWEGNKNDWDATRFVSNLIYKFGEDTSEKALELFDNLIEQNEDSYTFLLRRIRAEQRIRLTEQNYQPLSYDQLLSKLSNSEPCNTEDLQAVMLTQLEIVQKKLNGHHYNWRRGFFNEANEPKIENDCRDEILKMLGDGPMGIQLSRENELAEDKKPDIVCTYRQMMLPIEVKGQWHKDVWVAAETQLDRYYTSDWRAERRGIYLVLWFGTGVGCNKKLTKPPSKIILPNTASELQQALSDNLSLVLQEKIQVVVLDFTNRQNV